MPGCVSGEWMGTFHPETRPLFPGPALLCEEAMEAGQAGPRCACLWLAGSVVRCPQHRGVGLSIFPQWPAAPPPPRLSWEGACAQAGHRGGPEGFLALAGGHAASREAGLVGKAASGGAGRPRVFALVPLKLSKCHPRPLPTPPPPYATVRRVRAGHHDHSPRPQL